MSSDQSGTATEVGIHPRISSTCGVRRRSCAPPTPTAPTSSLSHGSSNPNPGATEPSSSPSSSTAMSRTHSTNRMPLAWPAQPSAAPSLSFLLPAPPASPSAAAAAAAAVELSSFSRQALSSFWHSVSSAL